MAPAPREQLRFSANTPDPFVAVEPGSQETDNGKSFRYDDRKGMPGARKTCPCKAILSQLSSRFVLRLPWHFRRSFWNNPIKIRQKPKDPTAGRRLPTHLKTTKRCPTPDGMVGRTTRLLRAVGSSSVGMTADQMERRRQGQKERLAIRERRRNPGPPWERDAPPEDMAPRSHGIARTCA